MNAKTSAGTILAICAAAPATFDEEGFAALDFTDIGEVTSIDGNIGRTYAVVEHKPLASRATVKKKGSYNSGSFTAPLAIDREDAGQLIALAALKDDDDYSFCITEQDGVKVYFRGIVTSFPPAYGGTDAVTSSTISVEITANEDGDDFVIAEAA